MARGNRGQAIFQDDRDRGCFLEALGEASEQTGWQIHACVLMGNSCWPESFYVWLTCVKATGIEPDANGGGKILARQI